MNSISIRQAQEPDTETVSSILREAANRFISGGIPLWKAEELAPDKIRTTFPPVCSGWPTWMERLPDASAFN
jgi:hypothetical protein